MDKISLKNHKKQLPNYFVQLKVNKSVELTAEVKHSLLLRFNLFFFFKFPIFCPKNCFFIFSLDTFAVCKMLRFFSRRCLDFPPGGTLIEKFKTKLSTVHSLGEFFIFFFRKTLLQLRLPVYRAPLRIVFLFIAIIYREFQCIYNII